MDNKLFGVTYAFGGEPTKYVYEYERDVYDFTYADNFVSNIYVTYTIPIDMEIDFSLNYSHDEHMRPTVSSENIGSYSVEKSYLSTDDRLTDLVEELTYKRGSTVIDALKYTYDSRGNITKIHKKNSAGNYDLLEEYSYDALNRVTQAYYTEDSITHFYHYDEAGNITSCERCILYGDIAESWIGGWSCGYKDTTNKDRLTAFSACDKVYDIVYDVLGNPTSYKGKTLTWTRGKLLASYGDTTFEYNAAGVRTKKGTKRYTLDGTRIIAEVDIGPCLEFFYGKEGIIGFRDNMYGDVHYYKKNLQGDIIGFDGEDYYFYDAYGNCTVKYGSPEIAYMNPFRYRGYYYDTETGLYYLNSRYYDPETGRFINADDVAFLGAGGTVQSYNLYSYCDNNPVNKKDPFGNSPIEWLNKYALNDDGTYSLYDSNRFNKDKVFHEQFLSVSASGPSFDLKEGSIGLGSIEANAITGGWEWENADLSLLDFGHAEAGLEFVNHGFKIGAMASIWSPSFSFTVWGVTIEIGAEVGAVGFLAKKEVKKFTFSIGSGVGFTIGYSR